MAGRRRATIKDVAAATGLSPAAVSYALRGLQTSPATQERVRAAAEALGYTGNAVARALSQGRTGLVGVLSGSLQDLGELRFVEAIGAGLAERDLQMVVADAGGDPARERVLARRLADQLVDGLVVSPLDPSSPAWEAIGGLLPVVSVGDALAGPTVGELLFDNRAGVTLVLEHLQALGHQRIGVLTPSRPSTPDRPAERVVSEELGRLGLDGVVWNTRHSIESATNTARRLLESDPRPSAVFCLSDTIAAGAFAAAQALAIAVPGELSVVGYDNHPIASVVAPALTTVEWGMPAVGATAAQLLLDAVDAAGPETPSRRERVAPRLVLRQSSGPPP